MEIKTGEDEIFDEVYKILKKHNKLQQVVWGTNRPKDLDKIKKAGPEVARFAWASEVLSVFAGYLFGYLPFMNIDFDTLQVPYYTEGLIKWKNIELGDNLKGKLFLFFVRFWAYIADPLFIHLQNRGIQPMFWVINKDTEMEGILQYEGLSGFMTDRPEHYIKYIEKKHK